MRRSAGRTVSVAIVFIVATLGVSTVTVAQSNFTAEPLQVDGSPIQGSKALSSRLAQTDRSLLGLTGSEPTSVIVKFDYDGVASYGGGLEGLRPTSPSVTGRDIAARRAAVSEYTQYLASRESNILSAIRTEIPGAKVGSTFRVAYGGAAMLVPANRIGDLLKVPGVVAVQRNDPEQPQTDATPEFLGADDVWPQLGGQGTAGENVLVGVIDTGVWPEHPSFEDPGIDPLPGPFGCEFGDGADPLLGDPFTCNDKLVGAYAFTDTYLAVFDALPGEFCNNTTGVCSARDPDGHGTHTSSTAVGSPVADASIFGISRGAISGMAPGAHLIMFRVYLDEGCFPSDSVAAVEQAIADGVDVLNFSISGGATPYTDPVELAFLDAYAAGILVNASAGNAGPGAGTADHGGPWTNTVGASTSPRHFRTTVHLTADDGATFDATGSSITQGIPADTPVIAGDDVPGYTDETCGTPLPAGSATGKIVVCLGQFSRNLRANNVLVGGGAGMLLVVPPPGPGNEFTDNFWVPTVMLNSPDPGVALLDFLSTHTGVVARWDAATATAVTPDVMTSFSSRGPVGEFLKPDVTAPGMQILAGHTPQPVSVFGGPPGELFQVIAGTSMSSPHAAGVSALVKAAHPGWTPGQVKSALMTSAVTDVLKEDGVTPADPFDAGAGSIRADLAVDPTLTFDETAADYFASAADPLGRIDLNIPSVDAPVMPGLVATVRTGLNVSGHWARYRVVTEEPEGADISVRPSSFLVKPGRSVRLHILINGEALEEGQYFGRIDLIPMSHHANPVTMPVAFFKTQGVVSLEHTCAAESIFVGTSTGCSVTATNLSPVEASYQLALQGPRFQGVRIRNVVGARRVGNGFVASGTLAPAAAPTVDAITPGGSPEGYLPLSAFGVAPIAMGDETIVNLNVPSFTFGTESYTQIGATSNGYAVMGGGDSSDVNFVPQTLPDPARPNNVLAPFWTDLNPGAGGAFRAASLTDGVNVWIVLDWGLVPTFGTTELQSFQIWIQTNAESVTYAYGLVTGVGSPDGLTVGAENRDGTSGVNSARCPRRATTSRSSRARRWRVDPWSSRTTRSAGGGGRTISLPVCARTSPRGSRRRW
ncbi:MAG: S8 family serine peptidase [Actinomycetota bacterium]